MYGRTIHFSLLLLAVIAVTVAGCQTTGGSRSTSNTPASGGHCSSCQ